MFATAPALVVAAAEYFVEIAARAITTHGRCLVALSGGTTPQSLYSHLATLPVAQRIDWTRLHLFWGDERCVGPEDVASNYQMTRTALLDHVAIPPSNVHRIRGEDAPPLAAAAYERDLRSVFATAEGPPQPVAGKRFDLVLLGMGRDGHTASLFPRRAAVREQRAWVMADRAADEPIWRVTLTPPVLNAAAEVIFLVTGSDKAEMLKRVIEAPRQPELLPAQAIDPINGRLRWMVDAAAASGL